jgi:hypothetical protein
MQERFMSIDSAHRNAGPKRRANGIIVLLFTILAASLCVCNKSSTGPDTAHCPNSPQPVAIDNFDPWYRIVSPNGGETFHVGQPCTVSVKSRLPPVASAIITVDIEGMVLYPNGVAPVAISPKGNDVVATVVFTVPDTFVQQGGSPVSAISDKCLIRVQDYNSPQYGDYSDCYFSIKP